MMNEYVYCPRLFYLEWVQGRFASSDDVEEGLYVHRVVDEASGDLPAPEDEERFAGRRARSVWLSSTELGVAAKIDIVEAGADGSMVPVDYKKGAPDKHGRMWQADRVQSAIQALLLREAGYRVETAEVWYDETRERVSLEIDDELEEETRLLIADMWDVATSNNAPAPLVNSPKCPRCSLVGICLPDEINALATRSSRRSPRRLMAPDRDSLPVYVQEQGALVGVRGSRLEVYKERECIGSYRLIDVSQVNLQGNVAVSPQAMRELFSREIPVCWFSYGGWFSGIAHGLPSKYVDLRRAQVQVRPDRQLAVARAMVEGKIRNSRTLLRRNSRADVESTVASLQELAVSAREVSGAPSLLGVEGTAARLYFGHFTSMLNGDTDVDVASFDSHRRSRRPPPDPVNCLLSFAYALLVKDLTATLVAVGLDPYLGVYHRPRYGRPALSLDLAEEFRPLIADSVVVQVVNNGEVRATDFVRRAGGCQLERDGRRAVLRAYERRLAQEVKHPIFGYRVGYRRALEVQARLLAAHLVGEIPNYQAFVTR